MNVLETLQSFCYENNLTGNAPATVYGNTDPSTLQLLHLLYKVGRDVRLRFNYPTLKKRYSFATVANQDKYELPGDFFRFIAGTAWDATGSWKLDGPRDDAHIVQRDLGNIPNGVNYSFRILGAMDQVSANAEFSTSGAVLELSPAPTDVRTITIEYISANFLMPKQWTAGESVGPANYRSANNHVYKSTNSGTCGATRPSHTTGTASDGTITWQYWRGLYPSILSDSDIVLIDLDVCLAGLLYQMKRSKGSDFAEEQRFFNETVNASMARFDGAVTVNAEGDDLGLFPNLDEGYVSDGW